jgi:predicted amino acid dehydrogenase
VALLRAAVAERAAAERHMVDAVRHAREAGLLWSAIGGFVGTSGEAARQRYSSKVA